MNPSRDSYGADDGTRSRYFDPWVLLVFGGIALGLYAIYDQSRKIAEHIQQWGQK